DGESLESYYSRFYKMMNELIRNQCKVTNHQVNVQFLLQLQPEWQRANQDNSPRINRSVGYENQRTGNVAGARETVGSTVVHRSWIQCYNCKEFRHVARECQKPKRQADWRDDTDDDELEDQELEAHYMYMAQLQEVSPDAANSGPIFDDEPLQKVSNDYHYNVLAMESKHPEQSKSVHDTYPIDQDAHNVIIDSLDMSYDRVEIDQNDDDNDLANERCYNDNLALMFAPESDEVIHLEKESRSKLSDLIRPFDYNKLNNLYDLFVPQREKLSEQRYFSERSRLSHTYVKNGNSKESFHKQTTVLEKRMDESIPLDKKCQSSIEIFKVKTYINTIINGVELCKEKIANRKYSGYIDPFIQNTIEANFSPVISRINAGLEQFHRCLNEEMVDDLRYFNSLELEVDSLRSQLETQKAQFLNEIDRLSREYYYADHMNAILGVYTELDEVTNL
nr:hypothetical protein [Tanacetum cinerariifolium]